MPRNQKKKGNKMSISDTVKDFLKSAGLSAEQIEAVEKESPPEVKAALLADGLTEEQLAALNAGEPDKEASINPSTISSVKTPTVEGLEVEIEALKSRFDFLEARFNRLASENFKPESAY